MDSFGFICILVFFLDGNLFLVIEGLLLGEFIVEAHYLWFFEDRRKKFFPLFVSNINKMITFLISCRKSVISW